MNITKLHYIKLYPWRWTFAIGSSVLNKIFDLMPPIILSWYINTLSGHTPQWINNFISTRNSWSILIFLAVLAFAIFMAESLFQWCYTYGYMTLTQRIQHDLRIKTYQQVQNREMAFFEQHRVGETMAMINDDVNQLERFLYSGINDLVQLVAMVIFVVAVMFSNSWRLALIGLIPVPFTILGSLIFQKRMAPRYKKVRQAVGDLATRLENNLSGINVIKSFTAEQFETERLSEASQAYCQANFHAIKLTALFTPIMRIGVAAGFASILLVGSYWVMHGQYINLAQLVMFSMLIQYLLWPLARLGNTLDDLERARASGNRVFKLLQTPSTIQESAQAKSLGATRGEIIFDHVNFHYDNQVTVLRDLNITIYPGEIIGVAGHTGAGKSTLIKLLLRFYDVSSGSIKIDGHDLRELSLQDLRRSIALVSQDVYLFHGTIAENIAYGMPHATFNEIKKAAQLARLDDFVMNLPNAYETIVGERGIKLSGGQRQRLSIARAILKDAPILILDEATSAVDTETERDIQQNLATIISGKTAIIIAHRLSTIRNADRILVLRDGQIVEQGQHDALIMQQGSYADLWKVQSGSII